MKQVGLLKKVNELNNINKLQILDVFRPVASESLADSRC